MRLRLQLFKRGARLVDHEVLKVEMNLVDRLDDFRIRTWIDFYFGVDRTATDAGRNLVFILILIPGDRLNGSCVVAGIHRQCLLPLRGQILRG